MRQAFVEALILNHFDLEHHIQNEMDTLSYAISEIFSQLTSDYLDQWHLVAFFSRKMIDKKLLAIVKTFKTWGHYLKDCKQKVLVLINHNNLQYFIDTKNLSSKQVWWAQKLLRYYF